MRGSFEMAAESRTESLAGIREFILSSTEGSALDRRDRFRLMMAVDEAATNIIMYSGSVGIKIECRVYRDRAVVLLRDRGVAFDPLEAPAPEVDRPLEEREVGGLGIFFVRNLTDGAEYRREGDENLLTLTVRHRGGGAQATLPRRGA